MYRQLFSVWLAVSAVLPFASAGAAPAYPADRPVTLVVPFTPGGGTDILARLMADKLSERIKQTVLVVNKPGASGQVAIQAVERAKADGYTLLFGSSTTHVLAPMLSPNKQLMDGVRKDFAMVSMVAETPLALAVAADSPYQTLSQFTTAAKTKDLSFGTFGAGSTPHLMGELLASETGSRLLHVPYKGSSPAISNLLGGQTDSVFLTVAALNSFIDGHRVRALAVTGQRRVDTLPDVPTFKESGVSGLDDSGWFAVFASSATPDAVLALLHSALASVLEAPDMQAKLLELGMLREAGSRTQDQAKWDRSIAHVTSVLQRIPFDPNR
jgi:tripartite-type tricarboxylate transporter receptor subunit TctC